MNIESLRSLQKRIREATGPDRNLDWDIREAFYPGRVGQAPLFTLDPDGLGPCVALMREVLPGYVWGKFLDGNFELAGPPGTRTIYSRVLSSECLTFLDAILSALIAQEEARHTEKAG